MSLVITTQIEHYYYYYYNMTVKETVDTSCLCKWTERVMCVRFFPHFAELIVVVVVFFYDNI